MQPLRSGLSPGGHRMKAELLIDLNVEPGLGRQAVSEAQKAQLSEACLPFNQTKKAALVGRAAWGKSRKGVLKRRDSTAHQVRARRYPRIPTGQAVDQLLLKDRKQCGSADRCLRGGGRRHTHRPLPR